MPARHIAKALAIITWTRITKKEAYTPKTPYVFLDEKRRMIAQIRKKISKFGIDPNKLDIFLQKR